MKVFFFLSLSACTVSALSVPKPASSSSSSSASSANAFEDEMTVDNVPNVFEIMDLNHDRSISLDEYKSFFTQTNGVSFSLATFEAEDVDNDGKISYDEFLGR